MSAIKEKVSKDFIIQEFVPPQIMRLPIVQKDIQKAFWFIDMRIVLINQWIRTYTGKPTWINNWHLGGPYQYSGFRPLDCPEGADYSQHRCKCASDTKVHDMSGEEIREIIRDNFDILHLNYELTTIELKTSTWAHMDLRWQPTPKLYEFNP